MSEQPKNEWKKSGQQPFEEPDEPGFWWEDQVEMLIGSPPNTRNTHIFGGFVGPLLIAAAGVRYIAAGKVNVYGRFNYHLPPIEITGQAAYAFGFALVALGFVVHFHYYWPYRNRYVAAAGKVISFLLAAVCLVDFFWVLVIAK